MGKDPKVYSKRPKSVWKSKWTHELEQADKEVREENPTWSKLKIHARFKEQNFDVSVSTVGRIISDFTNRGFIQSETVAK